MGTNYYVAKNLCECCNRYDEEYHIGKASYGWAFSFQGYRAERLLNDAKLTDIQTTRCVASIREHFGIEE